MGIDKTTKLSYFNIEIEGTKKYLEFLRKSAEEAGINEDQYKALRIHSEQHTSEPCEYYFEDGKINFSGFAKSKDGDTYISIVIPLSDTVMIDIIGHALTKFNKFKTAMETLK